MTDFLRGKKSYIVAFLLAAVALVEFLAKGEFSFATIALFFKTEAIAGAIATIRAGVSKS